MTGLGRERGDGRPASTRNHPTSHGPWAGHWKQLSLFPCRMLASEAEFHGVDEISCSESSSVSRVASPERPRSPGVLLTSPWALARPLSTSEKRRGKIEWHTLQNTRARDALPHQSSRLPYRLAACGRGEVARRLCLPWRGCTVEGQRAGRLPLPQPRHPLQPAPPRPHQTKASTSPEVARAFP